MRWKPQPMYRPSYQRHDRVHDRSNETDNRKVATRLRNHFARLLLAWWKAAHYIYSPDKIPFYRRALLKLISGDNKLYPWPAFLKAVHIDSENVSNRKDNPRIWFQYKPGYEFLEENEVGKKVEGSVQSFSTDTLTDQTPALNRRRPKVQQMDPQGTESPKTNARRDQGHESNQRHEEMTNQVANIRHHFGQKRRICGPSQSIYRRPGERDP